MQPNNGNWISRKLLSVLLLVFSVQLVFSSDLTSGYTFGPGEQNITHTKLNSQITGATINTTFFSDKSAITAPVADDLLMVLENSSGGFKKISVGNLTLNATALITGKSEDTSPATNDFFLTYDTSADGLKKVSLFTISNNISGPLGTLITNQSTNTALSGFSKNLFVTNDGANTISIAADEVLLKNSSGQPFLASALTLTASMATTGANALDTGAEAASTWYYLYVIHDGTNTAASLISTSATSPTLPTGYGYKALVGTVFNNASSALLNTIQVGRDHYISYVQFTTNKAAAVNNTSEAFTANELTTFRTAVSPIAVKVYGIVGRTDTGGTSPSYIRLSPIPGDTLRAVGGTLNGFNVNSSASSEQYSRYELPLFTKGTSRQFYFSSSATSATWTLYVNGFEIP